MKRPAFRWCQSPVSATPIGHAARSTASAAPSSASVATGRGTRGTAAGYQKPEVLLARGRRRGRDRATLREVVPAHRRALYPEPELREQEVRGDLVRRARHG